MGEPVKPCFKARGCVRTSDEGSVEVRVRGAACTYSGPGNRSSNLPPVAEEVGGGVLGVTWLVDTTGAPTHMCPVDHASGQFKIPGAAINEYKAIATSRGLPPNKMILLRNAVVHRLARLPNGNAANKRRIDLVTLLCWAQLVDVQ